MAIAVHPPGREAGRNRLLSGGNPTAGHHGQLWPRRPELAGGTIRSHVEHTRVMPLPQSEGLPQCQS